MKRKGLAIGIIFLFLISSIPLTNGGSNVRTGESSTNVQKEEYQRYINDWSVHPSNQSIGNEMGNPVFKNEELSNNENIKSTAGSTGGPMNSSWPMCCHDLRHTSLSPYSTVDNPDVVKWQFKCGWVDGGIAIDDENVLYFGDNDEYLDALYPNGTMKWRYHVGGWIETTPAIGSDGTIYAGCWNGLLYAFSPNGSLKWSYNCGGGIIYASPVIADDGTIYTASNDPSQSLFAINPDGTEKWRYRTGAYIDSAPAIGEDGTVFFGSADTYVYAVYANGTLCWRFKTGDRVMGSPSIAEDGTVYIGSWDGFLYALNPLNGSMIWRCPIGLGTKVNPSIGPDGTIYVGYDKLYAVYPNGTLRWACDLGPLRYIVWSSPAVSADGTIYVGTNIGDAGGGEIIAVNPDGTEHWRKMIGTLWVDSSPSIAADGTVYIGSSSANSTEDYGYLYAFGLGKLVAEANGPYTGYYHIPLQFTGTIFGGIPPYSCHWDFGDGQTSNEQNPRHNYSAIGNFTATFTVTDSEDNSSSDTATVTISYAPPSVTITKPLNGIYLMDTRVLPIHKYIIIGQITIEADAHEEPLGIARVEFSVDGKLKVTDTEAPYSWTWNSPAFFKHTITVTAYDTSGKSVQASIVVSKFF
jgi:outer membrane protein assembly factor BamB